MSLTDGLPAVVPSSYYKQRKKSKLDVQQQTFSLHVTLTTMRSEPRMNPSVTHKLSHNLSVYPLHLADISDHC